MTSTEPYERGVASTRRAHPEAHPAAHPEVRR